jgi:nitroreductase
MELAYQAAFRAPDHSWLRPWRFIEITGNGRNKLGEIFLNSAKKISEVDEEKANKILALPLRSPMIIIVISEIFDKPNVPRLEQIQATAASTQNILLALHDMGYGAYWRTGNYSTENNKYIANELSLNNTSEVLGYLYVGSPAGESKKIPSLNKEDYVTNWD